MPTKTTYDKIALRQILSDANCRAIDENGRLFPPSHDVYQTISHMMADKGSVITPKHVYTIINNNRAGFRDLIMEIFDIRPRQLSIVINDSNYSEESSKDLTTDTLNSLTSIRVKLVISQEKWQNIKPHKKIYGNRIYWKLRQGWADVVAEALWVQHHQDCVFVFKNHSIFLSSIAKFFLTIEGFCRECGAKIYCTLLKEPQKNVDVILECNVDGVRVTSHSGNKRRQLRGAHRLEVANYLIDGRKDAVTWRRKEAGRIKQFGGKNPPILPTNEVVRKAKEQRLLSKYGLHFGNPSLNLLKSAEHGKFLGSIQSIGLYKFNCIYWLPEQLQIYISRCRKDSNATLTIDATGGIAKRDKSQKPHIFLYQCVLVTKEGSVPTFQMVSADQRSIIVTGFLSHILAANAPIPPIVVTDFGWSLLIAVAQIFGQCSSLNDYLQKCYDAIVNGSTSLPSTFMRLDVCHLASMITRWPSLRGKDKSLVRRFYKRCVGKACQISNLEDLSYFLESVLVVALSQCIGSGPDNKALPSVDRLHFLNNKIKGVEMKNDDYDDDDEEDYRSDQETNDKSDEEPVINTEQNAGQIVIDKPGWKSWCDGLYGTAVKLAGQSSNGDTINACYNIDVARRLKRYLIPYSPLWTAIMVPIFGRGSATATSAAVEAEFSDLKNREFRGEIPMRIDRFVMQHLEQIDNKIKERCKTSDSSPQNGNKISEATNLSKDEKQLNNIELNYSHFTPLQSDEISFNDTANTITNTQNERTTDIRSSIVSKVDLPPSDISNPIAVSDASNTSRDENIPVDNDWNIQEEWGGLNKNSKRKDETDGSPDKKRAKPTCLDDCPEWDFIKNSKTAHAPVLLNGNIAGSVHLDGICLNVTSTCAFDSIFQAILGGLLSNTSYSKNLKSSNCSIIHLAQSISTKKKILREHYIQRARILTGVSIFRDTVTTYSKKIKRIDVKCNAAHLAQYILIEEPSYTCYVNCSCGYTNRQEYTFVSVNIDIILSSGLHLIQEAINDCIAVERSCYDCKQKITCLNEYGAHLIIDTTVFSDPNYTNKNKTVVPRLDSLKKIIEVGSRMYMLAAVVNYNKNVKHYTTYSLTGEFWYNYDGLLKKRMSASTRTKITPHIILYTICSK